MVSGADGSPTAVSASGTALDGPGRRGRASSAGPDPTGTMSLERFAPIAQWHGASTPFSGRGPHDGHAQAAGRQAQRGITSFAVVRRERVARRALK